MKIFIILFFLLFSVSLFAADSCSSPGSTYLDTTNTTGSDADVFKKICLPDSNGTEVETMNLRGGVKVIGSQVMCKGASGICTDPGSGVQNNDISDANMIMADYDDANATMVASGEAATTTTSSMAELSLGSEATVLWAKLYWIMRFDTEAEAAYSNIKTVQFMTPSSSGVYKDVTCTHYGYSDNGNYNAYCSADVTADVNASGEYWVGDVQGDDLSSYFAAWSLFVVYEDPSETLKNVSIYEGFDSFYNSSLEIDISGFVTPLSGDVNATFHIFAGESDDGYNDKVEIKDSAGAYHVLNNPLSGGSDTDFLDASISEYGVHNTDRLPNYTNALGIDVDSVEIVDGSTLEPILGNEQTTTTIKFTSSGDRLYIPVVGFSTELYEPTFCYDYAYSQNDSYFTEDNNGSSNPSIVGSVIQNVPVETTIYIRNLEADVNTENAYFRLKDINTSQAEIQSTGFEQTNPGEVNFHSITPDGVTTSDFNTSLADEVGSNQGVYTKFQMNPLVDDLNMTLDGYFSYTYSINGTTVDVPDRQLTEDIPLCTSGENVYTPEWGIFNIIDRAVNVTGYTATNPGTLNATLKYNLFTQVAQRASQFEIVSHDAVNTSQIVSLNNLIGVEIINAGGFHDINASCGDSSNAISDKLWVNYSNDNATGLADLNVTHKYFDIQKAIDNQPSATISSPEEFFKDVSPNAAFRIWYLVVDANGTAMEFVTDADPTSSTYKYIKYENFPDLNGAGCGGDDNPITVSYIDKNDKLVEDIGNANVACGSSGTYYPASQMAACAECISFKASKPICSRDNFSVRPESFDISISDIDHNEADPALQDASKVLAPKVSQLSAGYDYRFDINATSHTSNEATAGYTLKFAAVYNADRNITFNWAPTATGLICNDANSSSPEFFMSNGEIKNSKRAHGNVGEYDLSMIDSTFTKVDQTATHHVGVNFLSGADCLLNGSSVPSKNVYSNASNLGCNIESLHTNDDNSSLSTQDYNITFVPYKFDMQTFTAQYGSDFSALLPLSTLYMSDLNRSTDMAIHYVGNLVAAGEDNTSLSNFTDGCYAQALDVQLDHNATMGTTTVPNFQSAYSDTNGSFNTGAINVDTTTTKVLSISPAYFTKANAGTIPGMQLHFNYERNVSDPKEVTKLHIGDLNTSCTTVTECQSYADLNANHNAEGIVLADSNVTFFYGRAHAPRYRIEGANGNVKIYYEVYCKDANCAAEGLLTESSDDVYWYTNTAHTLESRDGDANRTTFVGATNATQVAFDTADVMTNGIKSVPARFENFSAIGYPFKSKINMTPSPWLIYNPYNDNALTNSFMIEFYNSTTTWSGDATSTSSKVDDISSKTTNRRINW